MQTENTSIMKNAIDLTRIYAPSLGRSLSAIMALPSSAHPDKHIDGLELYAGWGGDALHLHGEGGEIHSRQVTGEWLTAGANRDAFFLCTQICHDAWDEEAQSEINRFLPEAVHDDLELDLRLLGTSYVDMVYLDDRPNENLEPVIEAICSEISCGRVRAFGVRNFTAERVRDADAIGRRLSNDGVTAIITTELTPLVSRAPLWPGYVPFDLALRQAAVDLELVVFAHAEDWALGYQVLEDEELRRRLRPEWIQRWQHPDNTGIVRSIKSIAVNQHQTPRAVLISCLIDQPFPVIPIVSLSTLLSEAGVEYFAGAAANPANLAADIVSKDGKPLKTNQA